MGNIFLGVICLRTYQSWVWFCESYLLYTPLSESIDPPNRKITNNKSRKINSTKHKPNTQLERFHKNKQHKPSHFHIPSPQITTNPEKQVFPGANLPVTHKRVESCRVLLKAHRVSLPSEYDAVREESEAGGRKKNVFFCWKKQTKISEKQAWM